MATQERGGETHTISNMYKLYVSRYKQIHYIHKDFHPSHVDLPVVFCEDIPSATNIAWMLAMAGLLSPSFHIQSQT